MDGVGDGEFFKFIPVEDVFRDFEGRRAGIIKALTTDFLEFHKKCDPAEDNLCLYGYPNEQWEVKEVADEIPSDLPEPVFGINYVRAVPRKDWLAYIAVHSDSWLLSLAYYFGAKLNKADRERLYTMISELPTIYEVVTGKAQRHTKKKPNASNNRGSKKHTDEKNESNEEEDEDEDEEEVALCGTCGKKETRCELWICCDRCHVWYHGKCPGCTRPRLRFLC